jgi:hypothetical protein
MLPLDLLGETMLKVLLLLLSFFFTFVFMIFILSFFFFYVASSPSLFLVHLFFFWIFGLGLLNSSPGPRTLFFYAQGPRWLAATHLCVCVIVIITVID